MRINLPRPNVLPEQTHHGWYAVEGVYLGVVGLSCGVGTGLGKHLFPVRNSRLRHDHLILGRVQGLQERPAWRDRPGQRRGPDYGALKSEKRRNRFQFRRLEAGKKR